MRTKGLFFIAASLTVAGAIFLGFMSHRPDGNEPPNVIVILIDALRADHLGVYGYTRDTTPNLDRFSREAVIFRRAMSQTSWTKPSIPSLFTSLYPTHHGVLEGNSKDTKGHITSDVLQDSLETMAEDFHDRGYETVAFVHNAQLRGFLGFAQGFDLYEDRAGDADHINASFEDWLDHRASGPFFTYLHYLDVHWPYQPPAPYDTLFGTYPSGIDFNTDDWKVLREEINDGTVQLGESDRREMVALYDGSLRYLDDRLGRLFSDLRRRGLYDNTLIVVTADHGEEFLEHGKIGHGQSLYRELLWIPLLIKFPGGKWGGEEIGELAELIDLLPTLTDYLGGPAPADIDGRSLMPLISRGRSNGDHIPFAYSELYHRGEYQRSLTGEDYALIETYKGNFRPVDRPSILEDFHVGDRVEAEGMPGKDHTFHARRIDLDDNQADDDHELEGPISNIDPSGGTFSLMGFQVVALPGVTPETKEGEPLEIGDLREGMKVKLNGHVRPGGVFEADRVKVKGSKGRRFKLEGLIEEIESSGRDSVQLSVMGLRVLVAQETGSGSTPPAPVGENGGEVRPDRVELYHLREDRQEQVDLSRARADQGRRLMGLLDEGFPSLTRQRGGKTPAVRELDAETVEELKAIGYVQ